MKEPFLLCAQCALRSVEGNTGEGMRCVPFSYLFLWLFRFPVWKQNRAWGERGRNANYCQSVSECFGLASVLP